MSSRAARHWYVVSAALIVMTSGSCSHSRELTPAKAADLIRMSPDFNATANERFWLTSPLEVPGGLTVYSSDEKFARILATSLILKSKGLVEITADGPSRSRVSFTEKGEREAATWGHGTDGAGEYWDIPFAKRELLQVAGVTQESPGIAKADYTYKYVLFGGVFDEVPLHLQNDSQFRDVQTRQAQFKLYDDGWRLVSP